LYGTVLTAVAIIVAVILGVIAHRDARNPPVPDTTEVIATNPSNSTAASDAKLAMRVVCAWKSAVSTRKDAMTCMMPPANFIFDPCFTPGPLDVDPTEVLCPDPQRVADGTASGRMRVIGIRDFVNGPPFPTKVLEDVMASDLPWAVRLATSDEWCVLQFWMDQKDLGVNLGSRPYLCTTDNLMAYINGPDAFFSNRSRIALKVTMADKKIKIVSELEHHGSLWTAQIFEPSSSSTKPVRISTIVY
jgi:hypothetical protein